MPDNDIAFAEHQIRRHYPKPKPSLPDLFGQSRIFCRTPYNLYPIPCSIPALLSQKTVISRLDPRRATAELKTGLQSVGHFERDLFHISKDLVHLICAGT